MATQLRPDEQATFRGLVTTGNPLTRPRNSASFCQNFRVMPGDYIRLIGGRKARKYESESGSYWQQFHEFRSPAQPGWTHHLVQHRSPTGPTVKWKYLSVSSFTTADLVTISGANDGAFSSSNIAAITNTRDKAVFYNGLGVRDATNSRPPFTSYDGVLLRYVGLDGYCPSSNPTVAFAAGAGNNTVLNSVKIWVGLYNVSTGHFSNGVLAGTITTTGATGTITVSNLDRLKTAYNSVGEQAELRYVYYATIDGGNIPYMILNATLDGPLATLTTTTTQSLSVASGTTNGWVLDLTAEMPTENFPPRPMRTIAYVNGRMYGVLLSGGSGAAITQTAPDGTQGPDFKYTIDARYTAGIVYSAAASDSTEKDFVGNPEESWPITNFSPSPNAEVPLKVAEAPDGKRLLVICPTATYLVQEASDGIHEWTEVSPIHGIQVPATYAKTHYGSAWVTQRNQVVLLRKGEEQLEVISREYQNQMSGTINCAAYFLDPLNEIDRYQVYFASNKSVVHDFAIGGQAYTTNEPQIKAAKTVARDTGVLVHLIGQQHLYTHLGQPEDGLEVTYLEDYDGAGAISTSEIDGEYRRQWDDFGDSSQVKELAHVDLVGDSEAQMQWYADFEQVIAGNRKDVGGRKIPQSTTGDDYRFKVGVGNRKWYKIGFVINGHYADLATHTRPDTQGDLDRNFYGSIMQMRFTVNFPSNRP